MDRIQLSLKAAEPQRAVNLLLTPGVSRSSWYLFNQLKKGKSLNLPWSHPLVLNLKPLDWKASALTTRPLLLFP